MADLSGNYFCAAPDTGAGAGVLVLHAWWGLNDFCRDFCRRLAGEGFTTLAPDLYHGRVASTIDQAKLLRSKLKREQAGADLLAAVEYLRRSPAVTGTQLGAIGFSLGAHWALWTSLEAPDAIRAVVAFYGTHNADYSGAQAAYLGHFAERDEWVAASGVKALEKGLRTAQRPAIFYTYPGTGHWFFEKDRPDAYNAQAAELAWQRTVDFLHAQLGG